MYLFYVMAQLELYSSLYLYWNWIQYTRETASQKQQFWPKEAILQTKQCKHNYTNLNSSLFNLSIRTLCIIV